MYEINKKILQTPVEDGNVLLLEPETGLYFEMNETAVLIYQGIQAGLNEKQIIEKILDKYSIDVIQATDDLKGHLSILLEQNIIKHIKKPVN